jgi:hypothetical protein
MLIRGVNARIRGLNYNYKKVREFSAKILGPKHN